MRIHSKSAGRFSPAFLFNQNGLHPAVKIMAFILMAILIQHSKLRALVVLAVVLLLALFYFRVSRFMAMIRRMRWLFLSMLIVYAYTTPGEYLNHWPFDMAPSYEGLRDGFYQIARISLVLASISLLMATSTRENLMTGIYALIKPLSFLGISPERFTARLYLTLQYMDQVKKQSNLHDKTLSWPERFYVLLSQTQESAACEMIRLEVPPIGLFDCVCVAVLLILIGWS